MTTSRDPTFLQALEAQLDKRELVESPFAAPPMPSATPLQPGSFPTPHADVVLNPKLAETMTREREAYLRRIKKTQGAGNYEFRYDVFIVYRSPGSCFECKLKTQEVFDRRGEAIKNGEDPSDIEPGFDFQNCPHHRREEYVALMNRAVKNEVVIGSHREETLQSGAVQVCVSWGEPIKATPRGGQNTPPREPRSM